MLDCLSAGADGVWGSLAEEGAAQGHACSAVALANLARLGNKDVVRRYKCNKLGPAARVVTQVTTGNPPGPRQVTLTRGCIGCFEARNNACRVSLLLSGPDRVRTTGDRGRLRLLWHRRRSKGPELRRRSVCVHRATVHDALTTRVVSDGDGVIDEVDHFSLAELFGVEDPPIRLTELASPELFIKRLIQCFGEDQENFTMEMAEKLHSFVHANLENDTSMEFTSALGLYPSILPWGAHTQGAPAAWVLGLGAVAEQLVRAHPTWALFPG